MLLILWEKITLLPIDQQVHLQMNQTILDLDHEEAALVHHALRHT